MNENNKIRDSFRLFDKTNGWTRLCICALWMAHVHISIKVMCEKKRNDRALYLSF